MITLSEPVADAGAFALDSYRYAIRVVAQYTVELEHDITEPHREYLSKLADETADTEDALRESRATLRGLLRDYRDKASHYINGLREELASNARSLEDAIASLTMSGGDSATSLRTAIRGLREAGNLPDEVIRQAIETAAANVELSLDDMEKQHKITVSQFQEEIRMLHKRIGSLEAAASIDRLTKLFNRSQMDERIREMDPESSVLLVRTDSLRRIEAAYGAEVADELAGAFIKRLRNGLHPTAVIGRWDHEQFLAILPLPKSDALSTASWITEHLAGAYVCMQKGKMVRPKIELTATAESPDERSADELISRINTFFMWGTH